MSSPRLLSAVARSVLVASFMASGFCAPARAADVTPEQATDLEAQLRGWIASLISPAVDVGQRPILVTPDGDHFNVELPAPPVLATSGVTAPGLSIKMKAKPLDGGRWALDDLAIPSPLKLTAPKAMDDAAAGAGVPARELTAEISVTGQGFHAVFDPSYATTSSFDVKWTGLKIITPSSTSSTATSASHSTWQPAGEGKINLFSEGNAEKTEARITTHDGKVVTYSIDRSKSSSQAKSVSPASLATLIRSIAALVPTLPGTKDSLNPDQRTLARTAVFALRDLFGNAEASQTMEGIHFTADGHSGSADRFGLGTTMGVADGKLELGTSITLEGFDSPDIPKGVFRDYLPRKIALKPRISGIPSDDLIKLMLRAIDSDASDMAELQASAMALLGAGPLEIAIDDLGIDLGRATLEGNGSIDVASPTDITGDAEISVTGLDALIKRANTTPEIKRIAPVLIFLKGIGKQDGEKTVWNVNYEDNKVIVNDTDLSDLIPSSTPPAGGGKKR